MIVGFHSSDYKYLYSVLGDTVYCGTNLPTFVPLNGCNKFFYVEIKCQLDATDDIYCRFYCMLNMFRPTLCPSSGARDYYTDGRCLWYLVLWFSGCRYGVKLEVMCPVCRLQQQFAIKKVKDQDI